MEIEILEEKYNPLIKRKEIIGSIEHVGSTTPTRESVRTRLSAALNTDLENVVLRKIVSQYGTPTSKVIAHIYDDSKSVSSYEPPHILKRNKMIEDKVEE